MDSDATRPHSDGLERIFGIDPGDITLTTAQPPTGYRITAWPTAARSLCPKQAREHPAQLLLPRYRVVPFAGRTAEFADLTEWRDGRELLGVRLMHAAGGHGKTRLAARLATKSAAAGWVVWRVNRTLDQQTSPGRLEIPDAPGVLVVVDYADRWPAAQLHGLIAALYNRVLEVESAVPVRILLLARADGHWWTSVAHRIAADLDIEAGAVELAPLGNGMDRVELFDNAAASFATVLGTDSVAHGAAGIDLSDPAFASVLSVHMAALSAVDAQLRGGAPPTRPSALSPYLLRCELSQWETLFDRSMPGGQRRMDTRPEIIRRTLYLATLTGGLDHDHGHAALRTIGLAAETDAADGIIDDHQRCYPPEDPQTALEPLHPDRLGEDFVALTIPGCPEADTGEIPADPWTTAAHTRLLDVVDSSAPAVWTPRAITVLVETARRWPHVATEVLFPLLRQTPQLAIAAGDLPLTGLAEIAADHPAVLEAIDAEIPRGDADLRNAAAAVASALIPHRLTAAATPEEKARIHYYHARDLNNAARHEEALAAGEAAVAIYQQMTTEHSGDQLPALARAFLIVGYSAVKLGRPDDAMVAERSAVTIYRLCTEAAPIFRLSLLDALGTLSATLFELGLVEEALATNEERVALCRQLAQERPDEYLPDLAAVLTNLGVALFRLERHADALLADEEAVAIRRKLVAQNPVGQLPGLAMAVRNLGLSLESLDQPAEALDYAVEAVSLYRQLAAVDADEYEPALADGLAALGDLYIRLHRFEAAAAAVEEAVGMFRQLVAQNPAATLPRLAKALRILGYARHRTGNGDTSESPLRETLDITREAVALHRRLAGANPTTARQAELASALTEFGYRLRLFGEWEEAFAVLRESLHLWGQVAAVAPDAYQLEQTAAAKLWRKADHTWLCGSD